MNRNGKGPDGPRHGAPVSKPKDTKKTLKRLLEYLSAYRFRLIMVFVFVVLNTASTLGGSYMLKPIINTYIFPVDGSPGNPIGLFYALCVMAAVYLVGVVSSYMQTRLMVGIAQNAMERIRNDLFTHLQKLPIRYYDTNTHGDLMSRFTNDVDRIDECVSNNVVQLFSGIITVTGTLILMISLNLWLTVVTLLMIPIMLNIVGFIGKRSRKLFVEQQQALGVVNGYVEEIVTGQKVVKVFCHENAVQKIFNGHNQNLRDKQIRAQFIGGMMGPMMNGMGQITYSLVACIGGILCVLQRFDVGGLTVFLNYSRQFSRPINEISQQMNTIFSALAGAERVFGVMDEPVETDREDSTLGTLDTVHGEVQLDHVTFGYTPDKVILKDINLIAEPGKKVAFVGSTGAGKTTITNLINRFYDIQSGAIRIDGVDIRTIHKDSLRSHIAMVLQDTHLFTGTIMENIRYGRLDATDEEVIAAAKTASAHSFIQRLPEGYQTVLEGDGANLSQGQRQLLNIARAAISKAPILILDEATSSVDTRTEKHIEHGMDRLMKNRTTFVIAHRLSTVKNADCIIVLEQGEIVERGTHQELLALQGRYYSLYTGKLELD
ncbi:MAG: ABC transporter ATP-binding protein [Candidatus Merdivicinus sp.]|jgi:ATP-binding cassette subfamily B multidrug efflux pump